jgi:hypothetical protein
VTVEVGERIGFPLEARAALKPGAPEPPARERGEALLLRGPAGSWGSLAQAARETARTIGARGVVWVCVQHPASKVRERLGAGWDVELDFVDAVSRAAGLPPEPGVLYCDSPSALHTVLSLLNPLLRRGPRVVVWDSLNGALPYASPDALLRAMTTVNARIHESGSAALYYLVEGSVDGAVSRALEGTVDRVAAARAPATWRQVLSLERPLLYGTLTAMAAINAGLTLVLLRSLP